MIRNTAPGTANRILRFGAVLTGVCLVSATALSLLYVTSIERIRRNQERAFQEKLSDVLGAAQPPEPLGGDAAPRSEETVYVARTETGVRYVAAGSAQGYQSKIVVLVAVDAEADTPVGDDPTIYRVAVVSSGETPGLGENINKVEASVSLWAAIFRQGDGDEGAERAPRFQEQFSGKRLSDLVVDKKADTDKIVPITGATISSRVTTQAVRRAVERIIARTKDL